MHVQGIAPTTSTAAVGSSSARGRLEFEYDLAIIGCGVGGHGVALHAVAQGLKVAAFTGGDVGGTCVNRGCVPSKALLAASGRVRELRDRKHLASLGVNVQGEVTFDRQKIADHAKNLAAKVRGGLENSLKALGVTVIHETGVLTGMQAVKGTTSGKILRARDVIVATGSVPFVPGGVEVDEKTVFTSDGGLELQSVPNWLAIVGSGYIGLEFSDVFTALGSEVTFVEAMDRLMPTFDVEVAKMAERLLIRTRAINSYTGVFATEVSPGRQGESPVRIKLVDAKTKEHVETLEVDACMIATGRVPNTKGCGLETIGVSLERGFVNVDDYMRVLNRKESEGGVPIPNLYCIGDANGRMMLAHAASAQGAAVVDTIMGRKRILNHEAVPAACFTHPEIAFVGLTEEQARDRAKRDGFELGKAVGNFRSNSKALAEGKSDGFAKVLFRKDNGKIVGVHIIGLHAADLIQECANAVAAGNTVEELSRMVHTHPTLSEVVDAAFKGAVGITAH